jgi:hypothetical protein
VIGAIATAVVVFFYRRDQQYQLDIQRLSDEVNRVETEAKDNHFEDSLASQLSDLKSQSTFPSLDGLQSNLAYSRQNAITRAIARSSDALVGISVTQVQ